MDLQHMMSFDGINEKKISHFKLSSEKAKAFVRPICKSEHIFQYIS